MKILVVAALISWIGVEIFAVGDEEISKAMDKCIAETKVNVELVQEALKGNVSEDPALKKDIACVFKELQILNGTEINKDKLKELLNALAPGQSDEVLQQIIDTCADAPGDTPEDKAVAVYKCGLKPQ